MLLFFRMFVTTLVFARKQEAVAQDAKAITTKEREKKKEARRPWPPCLQNASIVARYLHRRKKKREREREAKESLPLSRATICIVITIIVPTGDGGLLARKKNSFDDAQSIR